MLTTVDIFLNIGSCDFSAGVWRRRIGQCAQGKSHAHTTGSNDEKAKRKAPLVQSLGPLSDTEQTVEHL